jgi:hypothetical protein
MKTEILNEQDLNEIIAVLDAVRNLRDAIVLQDKVLRIMKCPYRKDKDSNPEVELMVEMLKQSAKLIDRAGKLLMTGGAK